MHLAAMRRLLSPGVDARRVDRAFDTSEVPRLRGNEVFTPFDEDVVLDVLALLVSEGGSKIDTAHDLVGGELGWSRGDLFSQ